MLFYEPITIGKIVDYSFKLVFSNLKNILKVFGIFVGITIGLFFIFGLGIFFFIKDSHLSFNKDFPYFMENPNLINLIIIGIVVGTIFVIVILVISLFYSIMLFDIFIKGFMGEIWALRESFEIARKKFFSTLLLSFLGSLMVFGGFLLCCIGIFPVSTLIMFAFPALLFENLSGTRSISRSIELVTKDFWTTFGYYMLLFAIIMALSVIYQIFASVVQVFLPLFLKDIKEFNYTTLFPVIVVFIVFFIINMIYTLFTNAFTMAYYVLLYFNQRIKYENFGIERLTEHIPDDSLDRRIGDEHQE